MDLTDYIPALRAEVGRLTRFTRLANLAKSLETIDEFSGGSFLLGTAAGHLSTSLRHERTRT
jgi:hypothetical protein